MDTKTLMQLTQQRQSYALEELSYDRLQEHLFELRDCLIFHNERYHVLGDPVLADVEFDHLWHLLEAIEKKYPDLIVPESPTQKLQGQLLEGIAKASHAPYPLFSLQNTYNSADVLARHTQIEKLKEKLCYEEQLTYIVEPKFDGISLKLIYRYGKLAQAITRGDGQVGEDVTAHALQITNLPSWLPALQEIPEMHCRGEVVMTKHAFKRLNAYQIEEDLPIFANARNAAAGTMRQLNTEVVSKRGLQVYIYDCCNRIELQLPHTQSEILQQLGVRGLPVYTWTKMHLPIDEVINCCETILPELQKAPIEFDGLVIKVEETMLWADDKMGATAHHPRRAVAYKFPAQIATTQLREIIYQVGRTGVVTPVAILEPVQLAGALISKATLHNIDQMQKMDLREQDYVWLQRSGEVIPYIVGPVLERRGEGAKPMLAPTQCPVCATALVPSETEIARYCPNLSCSARRKAQIKHFVSRQALAIDGLGESGVDSLVDAGIIYDYADLLTLLEPQYRMQLQAMPGIGSKKIHQLLSELERTKRPTLRRLLHGLGIPFVGKKIAQSLAEVILKENPTPSLAYLKQVCTDEVFLQAIFGIGKQTIQALVNFFVEKSSFDRLAHFFAQGVAIETPQQQTNNVGALAGQTIVITGTFMHTREVISQRLSEQGAIVASTVTSATTLLLCGEGAGSKRQKAEEKGVLCLDRSAFLNHFTGLSFLLEPQKSISSLPPVNQSLFG